ncbi:MAG TPA: hypothetical protein DCQ26_18450 [Marinilabiliales bacterium]|nr:MAG: hypothetical protein A2W95_06300 [Bacteroidetes bacterium GWA2_40_14]OFX59489.1 MAG: hypothetical protein A2W84_19120 [Bacteroidetes bacterium GWC2_40_13]OFX75571.1 MAG: hypothetical protein A2W96_08795 [Bacteroidetes bacterium GWD2_40_43]OFX90711.1 MAG: hypothetical protein A2W97_03000 [Bacteroidetes bacterium GWE2_40_63]OFY20811.1 MAG: hypothetical protein A2W88_17265 [Bacteroidetes bacterium GWF2_40_13]OFZ23768.1 MAG: hypothetical protein A2437_06990 [Bacteroidetes bacterium RIFOXYC
MRSFWIIFSGFLFVIFQALGQGISQPICGGADDLVSEIPVVATQYANELPSKKEQFWNNWTTGTVYYTNGKKSSKVTLRYNSWKDELLWLRVSDYKTGTVIRGRVSSFTLDQPGVSKKMRFVHYTDTTGFQNVDMFLQVIAEGKTSVYCYRKVTLLKGEDKFVLNHQYYIKQEGKPVKFKPRKLQLLSFFPKEKHKAIRELLRTHHLKLSNDSHLAEAIELINQMEHQ